MILGQLDPGIPLYLDKQSQFLAKWPRVFLIIFLGCIFVFVEVFLFIFCIRNVTSLWFVTRRIFILEITATLVF